ncbi:MAG: hypothetical protein MK066_14250, partial [Crocinitomicaceae bacterium]|nr:hypothetical protein [Crocinitomicaceae bacterium]
MFWTKNEIAITTPMIKSTFILFVIFFQVFNASGQNRFSFTIKNAFTFDRLENVNAQITFNGGQRKMFQSNQFGRITFLSNEPFSIVFYDQSFGVLETYFSSLEALDVEVLLTPNEMPTFNESNEVLLEEVIYDRNTGDALKASIEFPELQLNLSTDLDGRFRLLKDHLSEKKMKAGDSLIYTVSSFGFNPVTKYYHYAPVQLFKSQSLEPFFFPKYSLSKEIKDDSITSLILQESGLKAFKSVQSGCAPLPTSIRVGTNCSCNTCTTVSVMSLETYVQQGLNDEWIPSWQTESLKAGSLAYRTYGAYYVESPININYDISSTTCKQVWDNDFTTSCVNAATITAGEHLVTTSNDIAFSEYSAENNGLGASAGTSCGDGFSGTGATYPCISDNLCSGYTRAGHGRGMCQWGSQRWALNGQTYDWIVDHYYNPANIFRCTNSDSLDCSNAIALSCGVVYSGIASTSISNVGTYGCNSWTETGPERVHTITPTSSGIITATISNFSGDLDVYILGSCDPLDCLGTVSSSSATFSNAVAGQTYYIVVDSDDGSGSSYDILIDCPVGPEDVFLTNFSVSQSSVNSGGNINVYATQNYSGGQLTANLPSFTLDYYLSMDCNIDSADL